MRPSRLTLRHRLTILFTGLVLLQAIVLSITYLLSSTNDAVARVKKQNADAVIKNRMITDATLGTIVQRIKSLNVDREFFDIVEGLRTAPDPSSEIERLESINNRYFWDDLGYIESVHFVFQDISSRYAGTVVPYALFLKDNPDIEGAGPKLIWHPTASMEERVAYIHPPYHAAQTPAFTLIRRMAPSILTDTRVIVVNSSAEKPYLMINISPRLYADEFEPILNTPGSAYAVVTRDGERVAGNMPVEEGWLADARAGSGSEIYALEGQNCVVGFDVSRINGWILAISTPVSELTRATTSYAMIFLVFILGNASVIIVAMMLLSRRMTRPLYELADVADSISMGDLSRRIDIRGDREVDAISRTINQLNAWLEDLIRENAEVAKRERDARISVLQFQLNPHFLYNTLNVINLIAIDKAEDEISRLILGLSGMMQYTLHTHSRFSPAQAELDFTETYIYLMKTRFPNRFDVAFDIDTAVRECIMPHMVLQPFVENAILHGLKDVESGGEIRIQGKREGGVTVIRIQDNGCGLDNQRVAYMLEGKQGHIGCSNIHHRLKLLFGDEFGVSIASRKEPTIVEIRFPYIAGE